ncbi:hypothetical protein [Bacillus mycoides]|uniref:hypothetical protein n=1 Tax=Bacillus mycoides TaxID=1405 RepID=UPI003D26383D
MTYNYYSTKEVWVCIQMEALPARYHFINSKLASTFGVKKQKWRILKVDEKYAL